MKHIHIIGSGFSSLSAACYLAQAGHRVTVFEKNATAGGRARQLKKDGFTFDIGPTWYWMPDVFERFFADFGKKPSDFYGLKKLSPAYRVYFGVNDFIDVGDNFNEIAATFEGVEKGSGEKLQKFIGNARRNYDIAITDLVYRPGLSPLELVTPETIKNIGQFVGSVSNDVQKLFSDKKLKQILEFPVLFLGAKPSDTPPFYNFMNYADFGLGTWYPEHGMYDVVKAMAALASELGVTITTNATISAIHVENGKAVGIVCNGTHLPADVVLSGADYHHTETLLPLAYRNYSEKYWQKRTFAPSALLFYVGFDKKLKNIQHHTLFFDADFDQHATAIYDKPEWPETPLFYASFPSLTDTDAAPDGKEAGIFLIPLAPGIEDNDDLRNRCFEKIVNRFENVTGQSVKNNIIFSESFGINDFVSAYNSYKGNAYGLANTLWQTAFLRPKLKSGKVKNLFFTGQLTVPGPGVPPALISGKLAAGLINKNSNHEN
jgi:phytoene desaturase